MRQSEEGGNRHDEALRARLEPIGAKRVKKGVYVIGNRAYDLTASDPDQLARVLVYGLAPYVEAP